MKLSPTILAGVFALSTLLAGAPAPAADPPPSFAVRYLGPGSVVAMNDADTVIGLRTDPASGRRTPLVSGGGGAWTALPLPAGASGGFPTDVNDDGVIVGVADLPGGRRAVRWTPAASGYGVELLPLLPGELASYATGINDRGQVVGARAGILGTPFGFGWLYDDGGGLVDLNAAYGWFATPADISDAGVVLSGTQTLDLATGAVADPGLAGPANYHAVGGVAINDAGWIAGAATLRSSSLNIVSVFRYRPGAGWEFVGGTSRYAVANDINNLGDVCWGELGAGILLEGLGSFALGSLLDPAAAAAGWVVTGNGCVVNDRRTVATIARNAATGEAGAVLLLPAGTLPPPAAPTNLTATPHPATPGEPWVSIDLAWTGADPRATLSYQLERRVAGDGAWAPVALVPPATGTFHQDTTVAAATAYEYRVRAVGVAGPGPWSANAAATSPAEPLDTVPPEVAILSPADGATVSGVVRVAARATDDVALALLEIRHWDPVLGRETVLAATDGAGELAVDWDTRGLAPGAHQLSALAVDATGNWRQTAVTVTVTDPAKTMRVSAIAMAAKVSAGRVSATGTARVRDGLGAPVRGASVKARWTLPGGGTRSATVVTDAEGRAKFATSGGRGTYTLTILDVTRTGRVFDAAGSVLSASVTK